MAREKTGRRPGGEEAGEGGVEIARRNTGVGSSLQRLHNSSRKNKMQQFNEPQGREWETGSTFDRNVESKFCCISYEFVAIEKDVFTRGENNNGYTINRRLVRRLIIDRATLVDRCRFFTVGGGGEKEKNMSSFRIFPNRIFNFSSSSGRVDECVDEDTLDNKVFENRRSLKDITRLGTRRKIENGKFKSTERYP